MLSFTTDDQDLEGPATILASDGPVPLGEHGWRRRGEDLPLTLTALATEADVEEYREQQRAEGEAAKHAACNAAKEQLADAAGVTVEGMPKAEYNAVYLPVGDHKGWLRFESAEGKHLYRHLSHEQCLLHHSFEPHSKGPSGGGIPAVDGLLPVGAQAWMCQDSGWKDLPLTVSLLATEVEVETKMERLREARETQLAEREVE